MWKTKKDHNSGQVRGLLKFLPHTFESAVFLKTCFD